VSRPIRFRVHEGRWAVSKLASDAVVPAWVWGGGFASVTRTPEELSVVCREEHVPEGVQSETGWACLELAGPIPFEMTGVLHRFLAPLAKAGVPIFAMSTYDTDWVLVPGARLDAAVEALERMMDSHAG